MSRTAGFTWGVKINEKSSRPSDVFKYNKPTAPKSIQKTTPSKKRRHDDHKQLKPRNFEVRSINKRAKLPIIKGERLPVNRLIETLGKDSLHNLLQDLIKLHPEITQTVHALHPKVQVEDVEKILHEKFQQISDNLPYKGDLENDYSYLRVKPYLNEFLNCLSDFILNYLPPHETNPLTSLNFIGFATSLITRLPSFTSQEYKYINDKCYEQVSNTWLIILHDLCPEDNEDEERLYNFIKVVNDLNLKEKLNQLNHISVNKFDKVLEFINDRFNVFNSNTGLNDLITVDYSNYSLTANPST
jgi:protein Cut8